VVAETSFAVTVALGWADYFVYERSNNITHRTSLVSGLENEATEVTWPYKQLSQPNGNFR
jgi:hypothetical protein